MENSISNNSSFGLQSSFASQKAAGMSFGLKTNANNTAYYAKKGEPMYLKEMDADEDGIVSFDEFKEYCQANGISTKEMVKMAEMATSYRTMKANEKASESIEKRSSNNEKQKIDNEAVYAKKGDSKYEEAMDTNNDDKVSYKEYIEYCKENAQTQEQKSNTKVEETEDGEFKTTNSVKAINIYSKTESSIPEGKVDDIG